MNLATANEASKLVEEIMDTKLRKLDEEKINKIKSLCKTSSDVVEYVFKLIWNNYLNKFNSNTRYLCVEILDELFMRSAILRSKLLDNMNEYMVLTMGTEKSIPLPKPINISFLLKELALVKFKKWYDKFSPVYRTLRITNEFLVTIIKVNFDTVLASYEQRNPKPLERKVVVQKLRTKINKAIERAEKINKNIQKNIDLLTSEHLFTSNDFKEIKNCPKFNDDDLRALGIPSTGYNIEIDLTKIISFKVHKTKENVLILQNLRENMLIGKNKCLPKLEMLLEKAIVYKPPKSILKELHTTMNKLKSNFLRFQSIKVFNDENNDEVDTDEFLEVMEKDVDEVSILMDNDTPCCSYKTPLVSYEKANHLWSVTDNEEQSKNKKIVEFNKYLGKANIKHSCSNIAATSPILKKRLKKI